MKFARYVGIDYSGAATPETRLAGLQVYRADANDGPNKIRTSAQGAKNWSRVELAQYCLKMLQDDDPVIIGIDHGFSFPATYMQRYGLTDWDGFLQDFSRHWPTAEPRTTVDSVRHDNSRNGKHRELRLCEKWTATAKSVFLFDVQGSVAKSTHAGLPWLLWLRESSPHKVPVHFWPFDGFTVPEGHSVVAEAYAALYKRRFEKQKRSPDEHDAWSIAAWLQETDKRRTLDHYFSPPLTESERRQARLEGWILGVG